MAIAIAHELSNGSNTDASTYTSGSVSVTAGETLWAIVSNGSTAGTADVISAITGTLGSGLSWSEEVTALMNSSLRGRLTIMKAACPSTTSGTLTFNFGGVTQANCQWIIVTTTGNDLTVRQIKTGQMSGTNPTITLDSVPLATSMVLAGLLMNTNTTPTAGTGKTIIGTTLVGSSPSVVQAAEYDIGSATASTAFVSPSTANKCMVAIEIVEPAPSSGSVTGAITWGPGKAGKDLIADLETRFPVIANHRGGANEWPEDTYYALEQSWAAFPDNIGEYDLQHNASSSLVPMHDTTMDRTTTSTGNVSAVNDAAWASVVVDIGPGGTVNPGFFQDIYEDFRMHVHMPEIQTTAAANDLVDRLEADPGMYWFMIPQAFSKTYTSILADGGYRVCQVYSSGATIDLADDAARGMWGILLDQNDSDANSTMVGDAHALGLFVGYYTVNTVGARDTSIAEGADMVLTNEPTDLVLSTDGDVTSPVMTAINAQMPTPTVTGIRNATVAAVLMTATAAAVAPAVGVDVNVDGAVGVAAAQMYPPVVTVVNSPTVAAPPMEAVAQAFVPTVGSAGHALIQVVGTMDATAEAVAPIVLGFENPTVVAPAMTATATALAPTSNSTVVVTAPVMQALAEAPAPSFSGDANVVATVATALNAEFLPPVVSGDAVAIVHASVMGATAEMLAPTVTPQDGVVIVPVMEASAHMLTPSVHAENDIMAKATLNFADGLYLGEDIVDKVMVGDVQVWP